MSITPIEMYTMVPKSQEVSHLHHAEQTKSAGQQVEATAKFERELNDNSQKTIKMNQTDDPEYRYDQREGGNSGKGYQSNQRKKKEQANPVGPRGYMGPGGIDIRI